MRRTPMKRTPFKPTVVVNRAMTSHKDYVPLQSASTTQVVMTRRVSPPVPMVLVFRPCPKPVRYHSRAYRQAVASLPCIVCGVLGHSQAAHGSGAGMEGSKGMAIKSCDTTCFPACADRPGVRGHHSMLDQGAMFTREQRHALEREWMEQTQRNVHAMGLWPDNFPPPPALAAAQQPDLGDTTEYF